MFSSIQRAKTVFQFLIECGELGSAGAVVFFKQVQGFVDDLVCRNIAA